MTADEVRENLRRACNAAGTQKAWAELHALSPAYVNDVLQGNRAPGQSILDALELEAAVVYRRRK
jgi:DNA-binding transcriptional regulator YdaS (Cro superfamily)